MSSALPPRPVHPLHLVAGDSAAGALNAAGASCGLPGAVIGFSADLAHGPLDDAQASVTYLRAIAHGYGESGTADDSPFAQWQAVGQHLVREQPGDVIVWTGHNVCDATFLAMACDWLAGRDVRLWRVQVPEVEQRAHVALFAPEQLAPLFATRVLLSDGERSRLAQDYVRIRDTTGLLRRLERGRVIGVPIEHYDPWLLAACGPDWQPAAHVVGRAMECCDGPNLMGDAFFATRLNALIETGRLQASGPRVTYLDGSVRLAEH